MSQFGETQYREIATYLMRSKLRWDELELQKRKHRILKLSITTIGISKLHLIQQSYCSILCRRCSAIGIACCRHQKRAAVIPQ
jgi:hypothetical protein